MIDLTFWTSSFNCRSWLRILFLSKEGLVWDIDDKALSMLAVRCSDAGLKIPFFKIAAQQRALICCTRKLKSIGKRDNEAESSFSREFSTAKTSSISSESKFVVSRELLQACIRYSYNVDLKDSDVFKCLVKIKKGKIMRYTHFLGYRIFASST